jgi:hypothetical protein
MSSSTLATAVVMRCFTTFTLTGSGGTKTVSNLKTYTKKPCKYSGYINTTLVSVESVYFFYSTPV